MPKDSSLTPGDLAFKLLTMGFSVIPSGGGQSGKAPIVTWTEYQKRKPTDAEFESWAKQNPTLWGMVTGAVSGVVVVDCETKGASKQLKKKGVISQEATEFRDRVLTRFQTYALEALKVAMHQAIEEELRNLGRARPYKYLIDFSPYKCALKISSYCITCDSYKPAPRWRLILRGFVDGKSLLAILGHGNQ